MLGQFAGVRVAAFFEESPKKEIVLERLHVVTEGGDACLGFVGKVQHHADQTKAKELERKLKKNEFTIEDFGEQLKTIRKMGSLGELLGMIPGLKKIAGQADSEEAKRELVRIQAIIDSMTRQERHNHLVLNGKRRTRIASGSGTSVQEVNRFVKQFEQTRKMMKKITRAGGGRAMMRGLGLGS